MGSEMCIRDRAWCINNALAFNRADINRPRGANNRCDNINIFNAVRWLAINDAEKGYAGPGKSGINFNNILRQGNGNWRALRRGNSRSA